MIVIEPPADITPTPIVLDDVVFAVRDPRYRIETAIRCCRELGDVLHDGDGKIKVRKVHSPTGDLSNWRDMRSVAEARAYLVSRVKQ